MYVFERVSNSPSAFPMDRDAIYGWTCGDSIAATHLWRRYTNELARYFRRRHPSNAEDLTQQVLIAAVQAVRRHGTNMDFRAYVFAVARRMSARALVCHRSNRRTRELPLDDATGQQLVTCDPVESHHDAVMLRARLNTLPARYRDALDLYYLQEYGAREVATLLRVPIPTVRSRVRRGLDRLRHSLDRDLHDRSGADGLPSSCGARLRSANPESPMRSPLPTPPGRRSANGRRDKRGWIRRET